jgi:hypothetical protein
MDLMRDQISRPNKADDHSINSSSGDPDSASSAGETGDRSADGGADRSSSRDVIGDMNAARRSKTFVYLALLYAAAAVGSMIFVLTSDDEKARCQQSVRKMRYIVPQFAFRRSYQTQLTLVHLLV